MAKYHLTNKAVDDLSDIWNYTFDKWSEIQADKYYMTLLDFCKELADHPGSGKTYDDVSPDLLGYKVHQHIIFYKIVSDKEIEVIRILHSRMDLKNRMGD